MMPLGYAKYMAELGSFEEGNLSLGWVPHPLYCDLRVTCPLPQHSNLRLTNEHTTK